MIENSFTLGTIFRQKIIQIIQKTSLIKEVRGKGLLNAIVINDGRQSDLAWQLCLGLKNNGLLAKPTHGNIIRFAPPLVIDEKSLIKSCEIIEKTFLEYDKK